MKALAATIGISAMMLGASMPDAMAQPAVQLETQTFVERVTNDMNGRPRRILATPSRIASGDQIVVMVAWRNAGREAVRDYAITRPVPRGALIDPTDERMQVSVDRGAHWGRLDSLWLPTALGGIRRAVAADVTHVRWTLPSAVPPGQGGRLSYRATIQ